MKILGIETSCDDTSISIIEASGGIRNPQFRIIKNIVSSQTKIHQPFGGVVPNLAKREHLKNLPKIYKSLMASGQWLKPNLIAVTVGPGLDPALWTGIEFAKQLGKTLDKRVIGVNHLRGHLYSNWIGNKKKAKINFPAIVLLVSGGHTILAKMDSLTKWKKLGETRDDAAGEAFDKVARMLGLPYPGGPEIERLARHGNPESISFPRPMINSKDFDFSFSGLKTAVLYYLKNLELRTLNLEPRANVAASFQAAVVDVLVSKTVRAAKKFGARSILLCGGVAANQHLQSIIRGEAKKIGVQFFAPPSILNTDNAAMIAAAGYVAYIQKKGYKVRSLPGISL